MSSIYRPTRVTKDGRRVKAKRYRIAYINGHGKRVTTRGFTDYRATAELADKLERQAEREQAGLPVVDADGPNKPISEAVQDFLADLKRRGAAARSIKFATQIMTRIPRDNAWARLRDITFRSFTKALNDLSEQGRAPNTLNAYRAQFVVFLDFCVASGWLESNPVRAIKRAKKRNVRHKRPFTVEEFRAIVAAAHPLRSIAYEIAGMTGLRRDDMKRMTIGDVLGLDTDKPHLRRRAEATKSGRDSLVPVTPEAAAALKRLLQGRDQEPKGNQLFRRVPSPEEFERDIRKAGIAKADGEGRRISFHSLRYFFCVQASKKLPIHLVSRLMDHHNIRVTCDTYLALGLLDLAEAVQQLPSLMPGPDGAR